MRAAQRTDFGQRLFSTRESLGLSQALLGEKCGLTQSNIAELEKKGQGSASVTKIARVLGVDAHWLATGEGEKIPVGCPLTPELQRAIARLKDDELHKMENQLRVQLELQLLSTLPEKRWGNGPAA